MGLNNFRIREPTEDRGRKKLGNEFGEFPRLRDQKFYWIEKNSKENVARIMPFPVRLISYK